MLSLEIGAAVDIGDLGSAMRVVTFMAPVVFIHWLFDALVFPPPPPSLPSSFYIHEPVSLERKSDVSVYGKLSRLQFV